MDGFTLFRFRGIDVRLNWSVVIIAALITWSLAESVLPEFVEGRSTAAYWTTAGIATAAFLVSLAVHELSHSLTAHRYGIGVQTITLWLFGGVAVLDAEPDEPGPALRIAAAGPIASIVIGLAALGAGALVGGLPRTALVWLGATNIVLAAFNLLPAFPLDGGRIYQAWEWRRTGDRDEATGRAARKGLAIGAGLIAVGVLQVVLLGSLLGGLWLMMIGWFLREAARAEWHHGALSRSLEGLTVGQLMTPDPQTVRADITVESFIAGAFFGGRHAAYPVVDDTGALSGLITLNAVRSVPFDAIGTTSVGATATPLGKLLTVAPTMAVSELIDAMGQTHTRALVVDDGDLVGIVAPSDVARLVAVVELAHPIGHEAAATRPTPQSTAP